MEDNKKKIKIKFVHLCLCVWTVVVVADFHIYNV